MIGKTEMAPDPGWERGMTFLLRTFDGVVVYLLLVLPAIGVGNCLRPGGIVFERNSRAKFST